MQGIAGDSHGPSPVRTSVPSKGADSDGSRVSAQLPSWPRTEKTNPAIEHDDVRHALCSGLSNWAWLEFCAGAEADC